MCGFATWSRAHVEYCLPWLPRGMCTHVAWQTNVRLRAEAGQVVAWRVSATWLISPSGLVGESIGLKEGSEGGDGQEGGSTWTALREPSPVRDAIASDLSQKPDTLRLVRPPR